MGSDPMMDVCEGYTAGMGSLSRLGGEHVQRGSVHAVFSGLPVPAFNGIHVWQPAGDMEQHVRDFVQTGSARGLPMAICFPAGATHERDIQSLATSLGFAEAGDPQAAMLLSGVEAPPRSTELDVTYSSPRSAEDLTTVAALTAEVFGVPEQIAQVLADPATLEWEDLEWTALEQDGHTVAMAMLVQVGPVANIFNVGVPARHRRRGLGAAATWEVIRRGHERGARRSALVASLMGEPVYARMGFDTVGRIRMFTRA